MGSQLDDSLVFQIQDKVQFDNGRIPSYINIIKNFTNLSTISSMNIQKLDFRS
jgi:hypothetical protein